MENRLFFLCNNCSHSIAVNLTAAGKQGMCPSCFQAITIPNQTDPNAIPKTPAITQKGSVSQVTIQTDREVPWTGSQMVASFFLFGIGTGGVLTGINFKRMGKSDLMIPVAGLGIFIYIVVLLLFMHVLKDTPRGIPFFINTLIGIGFVSMQRPYFNEWKANFWNSNDPYKPNRIGFLFSTSVICILGEIALAYLFAAATLPSF